LFDLLNDWCGVLKQCANYQHDEHDVPGLASVSQEFIESFLLVSLCHKLGHLDVALGLYTTSLLDDLGSVPDSSRDIEEEVSEQEQIDAIEEVNTFEEGHIRINSSHNDVGILSDDVECVPPFDLSVD